MAPGSPSSQHQTGGPNPQDPPPSQNAGGQPPLPPRSGQFQTPAGSPYGNFPPPQQNQLQPPPPNYIYTQAKGQSVPVPAHPLGGQYIYQQQPNVGTTAAPGYQQSAYGHGQTPVCTNQPGVVYVAPQPQVAVIPGLVIGSQSWTTDLFDCMDDPNSALITCFVPCVTVGQIAEILDNGNTTCATAGMIYSAIACFTGLPYLYSCGYRTKLRMKFDLLESPAPDMIIHCLCGCCAISQEYRELVNRGLDPALGWNGVVAAQLQRQQKGVVGMVVPGPQMMKMAG